MLSNGHCPKGARYNSQDNSQVLYQYQDLTYSPVDTSQNGTPQVLYHHQNTTYGPGDIGRNGIPAMLQSPDIGNNNQLPYLYPSTMYRPGGISQDGTQGGYQASQMNLFDGMVPMNEEPTGISCDNLNASGYDAPAASPGPLKNYPTQSYPPQRGVSGQHICEKCPKVFTLKKDLERHRKNLHREENDPVYRCRCGKVGARKDNHICNIAHVEKKEHHDHVNECGGRC
ncbi:hypothetical protein F4860DRAFT_497559 [Xylaria cubensis]|nr:hypothetical protein F4860DRAFT_497559 [Xylaria cubensis]